MDAYEKLLNKPNPTPLECLILNEGDKTDADELAALRSRAETAEALPDKIIRYLINEGVVYTDDWADEDVFSLIEKVVEHYHDLDAELKRLESQK